MIVKKQFCRVLIIFRIWHPPPKKIVFLRPCVVYVGKGFFMLKMKNKNIRMFLYMLVQGKRKLSLLPHPFLSNTEFNLLELLFNSFPSSKYIEMYVHLFKNEIMKLKLAYQSKLKFLKRTSQLLKHEWC